MQENWPTVPTDISSQVLAFLFVFLDLNSEKKNTFRLNSSFFFRIHAFHAHRINVWYLYLYIYHKHLTIHIRKFASPIDP